MNYCVTSHLSKLHDGLLFVDVLYSYNTKNKDHDIVLGILNCIIIVFLYYKLLVFTTKIRMGSSLISREMREMTHKLFVL